MKRIGLTVALLLLFHSTANATWSVIALNARTGQVIIASATCVPQAQFPSRSPVPARDLMDLQAVIVPGVGVAACQASADNTRENQMLVYRELKKGTPPAQILEMLKADANFNRRQFGILAMPVNASALEANAIGWSGPSNGQASLSESGRSGDFYFQVQGNSLASNEVVHAAARAFKATNGTLADRVMAAMEGADANGGDRRCTCANIPASLAAMPCDARTSHVAYIAIAEKNDVMGATHSDGKYFAFIRVGEDNIVAAESGNPVKTLRKRYDAWVKSGSPRLPAPGPSLFKPSGRP
jgi:uncharacterized Ntn-hydrolase superfamily protein